MNSATPNAFNKDLSNVMVSFADEDSKVNKSPSKPPKPAHPFTVISKQQSRPIKEILKAIVQSGIDFERITQEKDMKSKKI